MYPEGQTQQTAHVTYEISPRFRQLMQDRITRLERDAVEDERMMAGLDHPDHIRRHLRLIAVQRAEALRMRLFLDQAQMQLPRPLIAL
jgi:hypothetical protein